jgi:hypothetical protein
MKRRLFILAAGAALLLAAPAGAGIFMPAVTYPTGGDPRSLAMGDVNGDGNRDLAVANFRDGSVSILLGDGAGGFQPKVDYPIGVGGPFLAMHDLNGDGRADIVAANPTWDTISVLLANADGTLQPKTDYPTPRLPVSVAIADTNGDGLSDIVVAGLVGTVSVFRGSGDGSFAAHPRVDSAAGVQPSAIAAADLNGDGRIDLAAASSGSGTVAILPGVGNGSFGPGTNYFIGGALSSIAIRDLNGDGRADVVLGNQSFSVPMLLGAGNGSFVLSSSVTTEIRSFAVAVADFNADGRADIAVSGGGAFTGFDKLSVLFGGGDGTFPLSSSVSLTRTGQLAVGDLNGDARPDVAVSGDIPDTVSVLLEVADSDPPSVSCGAQDGIWHASDVSLSCTAADAGVGLAKPVDAAFALWTSVPFGVETANAFTGSRQVCDLFGNCAPTVGPLGGNKVDKKAPTITLSSPVAGSVYLLNQAVKGTYACVDPGSGLASCGAPVPNGTRIDTASIGAKDFDVDSVDAVGNVAPTASAPYVVAYGVKLLFDPTAATRSLTLELVDAPGANVSSGAIELTLQAIDGTPVSGQTFSFAKRPASYKYSPRLVAGTHTLTFTAGADPTTHTVTFVSP